MHTIKRPNVAAATAAAQAPSTTNDKPVRLYMNFVVAVERVFVMFDCMLTCSLVDAIFELKSGERSCAWKYIYNGTILLVILFLLFCLFFFFKQQQQQKLCFLYIPTRAI